MSITSCSPNRSFFSAQTTSTSSDSNFESADPVSADKSKPPAPVQNVILQSAPLPKTSSLVPGGFTYPSFNMPKSNIISPPAPMPTVTSPASGPVIT